MPTLYVYAPISGQAIAVDCYCNRPNCPPHTIVGSGYCCPLDISGSQDQAIYFRGSSGIGSIKIEYYTGICASEAGDINNGVVVHMYRNANAQCWMAALLYGHLKNRSSYNSNGQIINNPGGGTWSRGLGQLPARPAGSTCYQSIHVHMQINGGSRRSISCNAALTTSDWIYNWYWNDGWC